MKKLVGAMIVCGLAGGFLLLADASVSDDVLIDAMIAHPVLIERPIVVSEKGVRLCRPKELVFELL